MKLRRTKTVFITGGAGFLGRHLIQSPAIARWEIIAAGSTSLDIRHRDRVMEMVVGWKPDALIHLAYRRDDRRVIVDGSRNIAEAAAACGARLVHLSTDVVFPGRTQPYVEADAVFPLTDYGRMKADAEVAVSTACPSAALVRTSLMYGTDHLAVPQLDVERAARGQSTMGFFTDEYRCPAHASDVAAACAALTNMAEVSGPIHIAGPQAISRADFAAAIAKWMGLNPALLRRTTLAESGLDRPGRIELDVSKAAALGLSCRSVAETLRI